MNSKTKKIAVIVGICLYCISAYILSGHATSTNQQSGEDGLLHIYFLDVGQGDAIYVRTASGTDMLMDAGPRGQVLEKLAEVMPRDDKEINFLFESHPDADHIGGMPDILRNFRVDQFFEPGIESQNKIDDELKTLLTEQATKSTLARRGMEIDLGGGARFNILFPDKDVSKLKNPNEASIIGQIRYGSTTIMLTGDASNKIEAYVMKLEAVAKADILKSDLLKLGHHGSRTSSSKAWITTVAPAYAVVSAGKDNRYSHPHKQTVDTLRSLGIPIFQTAVDGTIEFVSDGKKIWKK